jgi:hypothetical protein
MQIPLKQGKLAWVVYALAILVELYTAINPILLNFLPEELDFKVFAYTTYPRLAILITCSVLVHRKKFWQRYIKINALTAAGASSIVAYLFLVKGHGNEWNEVNSDQIHAMVAYGLMIFVLLGHYRTMLKWFPWTRVTFYCYKLVRFFHIIFFIVQESVGETIDNMSFVAFFSATLELLHEMMFEADETEKEVKEHSRHLKHSKPSSTHELTDHYNAMHS